MKIKECDIMLELWTRPKRLLFFMICDGIKMDCDISHTVWKMLWVEL